MKGSRMGVETGGWTEGDRDSRSLESAVLASPTLGGCLLLLFLTPPTRLGTKKAADSAE